MIVIGDEPHTPYDRPPLSKQFLAGDWDEPRLALPGATGDELGVDWHLGRTAKSLEASTRTLTLDDETSLVPDGIVVATGARARALPGTDAMTGVHALRTLDDARALAHDLDGTPERVVIVGAGFIGAEVAATCRARGLSVTLIDPLAAPMARVLGATIGGVFADMHRDEGVDVRMGVGAPSGSKDRACESTTAWCVMPPPTRPPASLPLVMWRGGPTRCSMTN